MTRTIEATCKQCEQDDNVVVDAGTHDRYLMREGLVQNMFPNLTPQERDILMSANPPHNRTSGISYYLCATCWKDSIQEEQE